MNFENIAGFLVIGLAVILLLYFSMKKGKPAPQVFRGIPALLKLKRAIGLSVEEGKRVHLSLGSAQLPDANSATALSGLSALERVTQLSSVSDRPPVATSGHGAITILSKDTLKNIYLQNHSLNMFDPDRGRLTGVTPFSYALGSIPVITNENVSTNILIGNFGPEIAYLNDAGHKQSAFVLAGSDSLPGQAVLYATAEEPLIGEETFAVPAYLDAGITHTASLRVQDILRWGLIILIALGVLYRLFVQIAGVPVL